MANETLNHRERVQLALNHQEPDRVPMDLGSTVVSGLTIGAYKRLQSHLKLEYHDQDFLSLVFQVVYPDERIFKHFDIDFRPVYYRPARVSKGKLYPDGEFIDDWGIVRQKPEGSLYYDIIDSPFKEGTINELESFDWPDPLDPGRFEGIEAEAEYLYRETDYAIVGPGTDTNVFELAWFLRGFEKFLMDLVLNPEFVHALLRRLTDYRKAMLGRYLELVGDYLDVVYVADDLATQAGSLLSPQTFQEFVKPYLGEYYQFVKDRTPAKLLLHCCGNVVPLLDDLIDIGVDIINPVQVSAEGMDTKFLKQKFGERIGFWGAVDTQHVLPQGTPEEVRAEVRKLVADLGLGGGFVLAPVHNIQPDVPPENICALYEEGRIALMNAHPQ